MRSKKRVIIILLVGAICFMPSICYSLGFKLGNNPRYKDFDGDFRVELIQCHGDWYFYYVSRGDSLFKVVSKDILERHGLPTSGDDAELIRFHHYYHLELTSILRRQIPEDMWAPDNLSIVLEKDSNVHAELETQNRIRDIYMCPNIIGRYYYKNSAIADSVRQAIKNYDVENNE